MAVEGRHQVVHQGVAVGILAPKVVVKQLVAAGIVGQGRENAGRRVEEGLPAPHHGRKLQVEGLGGIGGVHNVEDNVVAAAALHRHVVALRIVVGAGRQHNIFAIYQLAGAEVGLGAGRVGVAHEGVAGERQQHVGDAGIGAFLKNAGGQISIQGAGVAVARVKVEVEQQRVGLAGVVHQLHFAAHDVRGVRRTRQGQPARQKQQKRETRRAWRAKASKERVVEETHLMPNIPKYTSAPANSRSVFWPLGGR